MSLALAQEIESDEDFTDDAQGWAERWSVELSAARKALEPWWNQGDKIVERFRDERDRTNRGDTRWNLFSSNVQTLAAMLYGKTPTVQVGRRFSDANDDVARVASEILERLLNTDIERDSDSYALALQYALNDRLLSGMGNVRVRYVAEFETQTVQAVLHPRTGVVLEAERTQEVKTFEDVEVDYCHWKDQLWSPARVFHEVRWWAFRNLLSRAELVRRFGEDLGKRIPLNARKRRGDRTPQDPWGRAEVWEIWSKEHKRVFWYVEGFDQILDSQPDPLELEGFWPFPRPLFANLTTSTLVPRPDFVLAQDLYNQIDTISSRIHYLERCVRIAGVYDSTAGELRRLAQEADVNELIPSDNFPAFREKGGIRGVMEIMPLDQIVQALAKLQEMRGELIQALYQVTGMGDVVRGQSMGAAVTATEQSIKAKFGSVRVQSLQDEFARFASDVQKLKAEIISKWFEPQTIYERSNAQFGFDANVAPQAVELIKSRFGCYRVEVKPENVALTDFAQQRAERTEYLQALASFVQAAGPLAAQMPGAMPFLLQMLQWTVSPLKGSSSIEGVLDQAIQQAKQQAQMAAQNPQQSAPDPKLQALQIKGQIDAQRAQADMAKTQAKLQADLTRIQAETQAKELQEQSQARWNVQEAAAKKAVSQAGGSPSPFGPGGVI